VKGAHGGKVIVDGSNILDPKTDLVSLRKKVGMVFQRPQSLPLSITKISPLV